MTTPMTPRAAILAAADHLERNPSALNFQLGGVPRDIGPKTQCCPLAWIGHFSGEAMRDHEDVARVFLHLATRPNSFHTWGWAAATFYQRMDILAGDETRYINGHAYMFTHQGWQTDATVCAKALRAYADRFHPQAKTGLPDVVRDIFTGEVKVVVTVHA